MCLQNSPTMQSYQMLHRPIDEEPVSIVPHLVFNGAISDHLIR